MSEGSGQPTAQRAWVWQTLPQAKSPLVVPKGKWCLRSELSQGARTGPSVAPSLSARTIPEMVEGTEKFKGTERICTEPCRLAWLG